MPVERQATEVGQHTLLLMGILLFHIPTLFPFQSVLSNNPFPVANFTAVTVRSPVPRDQPSPAVLSSAALSSSTGYHFPRSQRLDCFYLAAIDWNSACIPMHTLPAGAFGSSVLQMDRPELRSHMWFPMKLLFLWRTECLTCDKRQESACLS